MLLFLSTSWENYLNIFENFDKLTYFLNSFDEKIIQSYMKSYNFPDDQLFIETYTEDDFWDKNLKQTDIVCILKESVKSPEGKINIILKKIKYDYALSLEKNLKIFKSSLYYYIGMDISNLGIKLINRILSGDPEITWKKILPFFKITSNIGSDDEPIKKLIMNIIESEIKLYPDYPSKLFEALTGAKRMSSSYNSKLELKLFLNDFEITNTNYHTCFGFVDIYLNKNFNSLIESNKKEIIYNEINYNSLIQEINRKLNQQGGNII